MKRIVISVIAALLFAAPANAWAQADVNSTTNPEGTFHSPLDGDKKADSPEAKDFVKLIEKKRKLDKIKKDEAEHKAHPREWQGTYDAADKDYQDALTQYVLDWSPYVYPKPLVDPSKITDPKKKKKAEEAEKHMAEDKAKVEEAVDKVAAQPEPPSK
jgi:hypothetical protein